jgi:ATPase subunit of ABC transporter with duplicated ATPase domains
MTKQIVTDEQIAEAAFYLWLDEGRPAGRAYDHWVKARTTLEAAQTKPKKRAAAKPKAKTAATPKAAEAAAAAPKAKTAARKAPARKAAAKKIADKG